MAIDTFQLLCNPTWLIAGIVLFTALYIFLEWHLRYWKLQGVPTDKSWPIVGSNGKRLILKKTVHDDDNAMYKAVGPIWGTFEGRKPALLVADPDLIKLFLIKDFNHFVDRRDVLFHPGDATADKMLIILKGDEWKQTRNILTPTFTSGKLKQMSNFMEEAAQKLLKVLANSDAVKDGINLQPKFAGYTMDIIANCAFGIEINSYDENDQFAMYVKDSFFSRLKLKHLIRLLFPVTSKFIGSPTLKAYLGLKNIVKDVIHMRKHQNAKRNDFLQLMLDAQIKENEIVMTEDTVIAQCMLFLLAGFDTLAVTLNYLFYELSLHPEYQQKLIDEIDNTTETHGSLGYDAIMNLEYLDMVISETLRMYPSATRLERKCTKDYTLGNILIKKGMILYVPVFAMHHDPKYYSNPEVFDPERFRADNKHLLKSCTYFPFGAGPRNCIGMRFAMMEMKIVIAYTLQKFRVEKTARTPLSLTFRPNIIFLRLMEGNEIVLKLVKRDPN